MSKTLGIIEGTKGIEEAPWDDAFDLSYYRLSRMRRTITTYRICGIIEEETT